jgi:hypothetical protein
MDNIILLMKTEYNCFFKTEYYFNLLLLKFNTSKKIIIEYIIFTT